MFIKSNQLYATSASFFPMFFIFMLSIFPKTTAYGLIVFVIVSMYHDINVTGASAAGMSA